MARLLVVIALAACCAAVSGCVRGPAVGSGSIAAVVTTAPADSRAAVSSATIEPLASDELHHPATGSVERKAILDGLRPAVQRDLGQKVIFEVKKLNVQSGFAYADVVPRTPSGGAIDYSKTRHRADMRDGLLDGGPDVPVLALLRFEDGTWNVSTFVVGPTDVAYAGWWREYGAPKAIFPSTE